MPSALIQAIQTALAHEDPVERLRLSLIAAATFRARLGLDALGGAVLTARGIDAIAETLDITPAEVAARLVSLDDEDRDRVESLIEEPEK
ncbi:hypothetical protein [Cryptosporangium sp. NPDC051539]|uniref:hypothetical protein n=1 Tax=Cryptosporangium sp. NPDC051539 TaxID=3363962 RepID=UPI00378AE230